MTWKYVYIMCFRKLVYIWEEKKVVSKLRITNDTAKRKLALMNESNKLGTKSEQQNQFILQTVVHHCDLLSSLVIYVLEFAF